MNSGNDQVKMRQRALD